MLLKEQIQILFNKIQYDRSLDESKKDQLIESMAQAEEDLRKLEEGKEASNV